MRAFSKRAPLEDSRMAKMDDADFSGLCPVNKFY
jgi:hypothetical protein